MFPDITPEAARSFIDSTCKLGYSGTDNECLAAFFKDLRVFLRSRGERIAPLNDFRTLLLQSIAFAEFRQAVCKSRNN